MRIIITNPSNQGLVTTTLYFFEKKHAFCTIKVSELATLTASGLKKTNILIDLFSHSKKILYLQSFLEEDLFNTL